MELRRTARWCVASLATGGLRDWRQQRASWHGCIDQSGLFVNFFSTVVQRLAEKSRRRCKGHQRAIIHQQRRTSAAPRRIRRVSEDVKMPDEEKGRQSRPSAPPQRYSCRARAACAARGRTGDREHGGAADAGAVPDRAQENVREAGEGMSGLPTARAERTQTKEEAQDTGSVRAVSEKLRGWFEAEPWRTSPRTARTITVRTRRQLFRWPTADIATPGERVAAGDRAPDGVWDYARQRRLRDRCLTRHGRSRHVTEDICDGVSPLKPGAFGALHPAAGLDRALRRGAGDDAVKGRACPARPPKRCTKLDADPA